MTDSPDVAGATGNEDPARALVVDDDPTQLGLRAGLLEDQGLSVVPVSNVETALEQLRSGRFDILVTDINLAGAAGDTSGVALAIQGKQIQPNMAVVGYSALYREEDLSRDEVQIFELFFQKGSQRSSGVVSAITRIAELARRSRHEAS